MKALGDVAIAIGIDAAELGGWIERRWVLPVFDQGVWLLSDTDVARARMIVELRRDLAIDEEVVPVILSLLDQVYALRRQLRELTGALAALPEPARQALARRLSGIDPPESP